MANDVNKAYAAIKEAARRDDEKIKQIADSIGSDRRSPITEPFGLRAAWCRFANEAELRRLSVLHIRLERRKQAIAAMTAERTTIMMRCIRRMRRAAGKE